MAPTISNGNQSHNLWVKHPDGKINQIDPGKSIMPKAMVTGNYEIASVEIVPTPIPHLPPGTKVYVTNVGQETIVFKSPKDDCNFILRSQQSKELADLDYVIYSVHIPPKKT